MMPSITLVNGQPADTVSVFDRGLSYGDGVFETIKIAKRTPVLWQQHLDRLIRGCNQLGINLPTNFIHALSSDVTQLCETLNSPSSVLKVIVTRGKGGRGYRAINDLTPTRVVTVCDFPSYPSHYDAGVDITLCETRLGLNPGLAGIKHLNRLEQVLARSEWDDQYAEGLLRDIDDNVIEGTMTNLLCIEENRIVTPLLDKCGVEGIVRQVIKAKACENSIEFIEEPLSVERVKAADGVFLTNSIAGVWFVKHFCDQYYSRSPLTNDVSDWIETAERQSIADYQDKL